MNSVQGLNDPGVSSEVAARTERVDPSYCITLVIHSQVIIVIVEVTFIIVFLVWLFAIRRAERQLSIYSRQRTIAFDSEIKRNGSRSRGGEKRR